MNTWTCCNKFYVPGVKACKKCGKPAPEYGIINESAQRGRKPQTVANSRDPLISKDDDKLFVSTLKMKKGFEK